MIEDGPIANGDGNVGNAWSDGPEGTAPTPRIQVPGVQIRKSGPPPSVHFKKLVSPPSQGGPPKSMNIIGKTEGRNDF